MKRQLKTLVIVCMAMVLCVSCKKDDGKLNGGGTGGGTQTVATVTTNEVTEITQTAAACGGEVKSENGWAVTERGVCWSIEPNPTPSDKCTVDGDGVGKFTSEITGLEPDTKYYVRAYAKNAAGTSFGAEKSFTTLATGGGGTQTVATVTTNDVTEITQTTAVCGGEVKSENGWAVTERGVCWSIEPSPTPSDNCTVDGDGIGKFTSEITGLEPDTKYYVRAYAKNAAGTSFGAENSFTTQSGGGGTGDHEYVDLGLPSGLLWATCNVGADGPEDYGDYYQWGGVTPVTSTFINVGWDICPGNGGSSSYNSSAIAAWDATHLTNNVLSPEVDAASVAWGDDWRMPTTEEWKELKDRCTWTWTTQGGKSGYRVTGTNGNSIFLPAAGFRSCTSLDDAGSYGSYWSSSLDSSYPLDAYFLYFGSGFVGPQYISYRYYGCTVRPVRPAL